MAFGPMLILEVVIIFSFIITTAFMFVTRDELLHKVFFALGIMLGVLVTVISATSLPAEMVPHIIISWLGLTPSALGIIIAVSKGKPNTIAKLCVIATTIYGVVGYFLL